MFGIYSVNDPDIWKPMNFKNVIFSVLGLLLSIHCFANPTQKNDSISSPDIESGKYTVEFRSKGERIWNDAFVYQSINANKIDQDVLNIDEIIILLSKSTLQQKEPFLGVK